MKIGIDLDGVLYPFNRCWEAYVLGWYLACRRDGEMLDIPERARMLVERFPDGLPSIGKDWEFYKALGLSDEEFVDICHQGVDEHYIFWIGEPYPGAQCALRRLREEGHTIHIITHRFFGRKSVVATEEWLTDNEIPFDTLTFAKDKSIVGVDLLLDDLWTNLDAMPDSCTKVIMDQSWNRPINMKPSIELNYDHRLFYLSNLPNLVAILENPNG